MFNDLLNFKSKKDRNDFFIALMVLAFFACLLYWLGFSTPFTEQLNAKADLNATNRKQEQKQIQVQELDDVKVKSALSTTTTDVLVGNKQADTIKHLENQPNIEAKKIDKAAIDSDGDGINDQVDLCPFEAGSVKHKGCPAEIQAIDTGTFTFIDSDADGIRDMDDVCPDNPGIKENQGCPKGMVLDADGDGLRDVNDKCPNLAGPIANNGCPEGKVAKQDSI